MRENFLAGVINPDDTCHVVCVCRNVHLHQFYDRVGRAVNLPPLEVKFLGWLWVRTSQWRTHTVKFWTRALYLDPNFIIFMQFSAIFSKIIGWRPSEKLYLFWLIHTARDWNQGPGPGQGTMGCYVMLCTVHTTQGQAQTGNHCFLLCPSQSRSLSRTVCTSHNCNCKLCDHWELPISRNTYSSYTLHTIGAGTGTRTRWVSILPYVLYTLHRDRYMEPLFSIVPIPIPVPVPVPCSVYEP